MEYLPFEDAGTLDIEYEGPVLDLYALAIFELEFHRIIQKAVDYSFQELIILKKHPFFPVAFIHPLFFHEGFEFPEKGRESIIRYRGFPLVKGQVHHIELGSLSQAIVFVIASVVNNPDFRAILQGLGGNILYGIFHSGIRSIKAISGKFTEAPKPPVFDPLDLGPNMLKIVKALVDNSNGKATKLKIKQKVKENETEIQIELQ